MDVRKLKRLGALLVILLVIILTVTKCSKDSKEKIDQEKYDNNIDIPTDVAFDFVEVEEKDFIRDYSNPTLNEEASAYDLYGRDNCYFDEEGLHILDSEYGTEIRLIANNFIDTRKYTNLIVKPDMDKLESVEYIGLDVIKFTLKDISLKETEKFLKDLKDEYYYEMDFVDNSIIYKAASDASHKLTVSYDSYNSMAIFEYDFYEDANASAGESIELN